MFGALKICWRAFLRFLVARLILSRWKTLNPFPKEWAKIFGEPKAFLANESEVEMCHEQNRQMTFCHSSVCCCCCCCCWYFVVVADILWLLLIFWLWLLFRFWLWVAVAGVVWAVKVVLMLPLLPAEVLPLLSLIVRCCWYRYKTWYMHKHAIHSQNLFCARMTKTIWTGPGICPTTAWCDIYWRLTSKAGPHDTFQVSICLHVSGNLCWGGPWSVPRRWLWWKERSKSLRTYSQQRHGQFWTVWIDFDDAKRS